MAKQSGVMERVVLVACGSYNPITNMHLRIFEVARDHLQATGRFKVVSGIVSPVHDNYKKTDLVTSNHRLEMAKLAAMSSDWIKVGDWEAKQNDWTCTRDVLNHYEKILNTSSTHHSSTQTSKDEEGEGSEKRAILPVESSMQLQMSPVRVMLLCGSDLLESFAKPGVWSAEHIDELTGKFGLAVIRRAGSDADKFIYENDRVYANRANIHLITEWIYNEVSSTKVRKALRRGESVRYVVQDSVIDYINRNGLYKS